MTTYTLTQGRVPLLISMPHNGQQIPPDIAAMMQPFALTVPDTDWYLDRLYAFAKDLGCGLINPVNSRYVIDLNRPPDNAVLYAGANNTELCPTSAFDLRSLYRDGKTPDETEVARRIDLYWRPYHRALQQELARLKAEHGYAILFEAHTIRSQVPRFFDGRLTDINFGTADGASCGDTLRDAFTAVDTGHYSNVLNGRFKGGYITRHYGKPADHIHAVQLELTQINYLNEDTFEWNADEAEKIAAVLKQIIANLIAAKLKPN